MLVIIALLSSLALAACTAIKPIYLQNTIDAVNSDSENILKLFLLYTVSILGILLFETIRQLSISKYRTSKSRVIKQNVISRICHMPPWKFQSENGQNYFTILNNEIDMLSESYYVTRLEFIYSVLVLISSIVALVYINIYLALIIIVSTICPIIASLIQGKSIERRTNLYTKALETLNVMIGNLINGYPTIKVNRVEQECISILNKSNETTSKAEFNQGKTKTRVNMSIAFLAYAGEILLVGFSIYAIVRGKLTVGALIGALQLSEMLAIPTNSISYQLSEMRSVKGIRTKVNDLLESSEENKELAQCPTIEKIDLCDVSFSYQDKCVFSHLNYCFEAGKKYLILGENGSGKSTLFKLLSGFETRYEGNIFVNSVEIRKLFPSIYDQIGIVLQDAFIFDDTLLNNITLYQSELDKKVLPTLKAMNMDAFLDTHDINQEYQATKGNLSGGEKQKIAMARVLVQGKKFILLDEATASMDKDSSREIMSKLLNTPELTIISIEHKTSPKLLSMYDKIIEIKESSLVERM